MSLKAFKSRLPSLSARRPSLEPVDDSEGAKDVDEKHAVKDDVVSLNDKLEDPDLAPGELTYNEGTCSAWSSFELMNVSRIATAGGMGRHLGVFTCTMLMYEVASSMISFFAEGD